MKVCLAEVGHLVTVLQQSADRFDLNYDVMAAVQGDLNLIRIS